MAYKLYLAGKLFPVTPGKIQMKIKNQNKTLNLISESEVNVLKSPGLTEIDFTVLLPNNIYPFALTKRKSDYYLSHLENQKIKKRAFNFVLAKNNGLQSINMKVSLEDYTIIEDAKNGTDVEVTIKLKKYVPFKTKKCKIELVDEKPKLKNEGKNRGKGTNEPETNNKKYKVVKGDCLWNIAKKYYGDGTQYTKIAKANNLKNPSLIYPGQTLIIP